ncbi:hypothetical protein AURDEDRAFT_32486, partial [Auricularia subglabra TFB-10046 SS5]
LGFWIPRHARGFAAEHPHPNIIFNESLCVLSALSHAAHHAESPRRIALFTDSQNARDMFNSLKAKPAYNELLFAACDLALSTGVSFRAYHLAGAKNAVADALSRGLLDKARVLAPGLEIASFTPPSTS